MIYLDNAATTAVDPIVLKEMMPFLKEQYGNPGSLYGLGRAAKDAVRNAREQAAKFFNADPEQIFFTSGGTEGNNMVFDLARQYMHARRKSWVLVSDIEHKSVSRPAQKMCGLNNFAIEYIPCDKPGIVSADAVQKLISNNTGIVSSMYVNNELGTVNRDLPKIADICHEHGALFHTDCVQAAGYLPIDVQEIGCDFATVSSHKIHGPKGVGAIYIKEPHLFSGMIVGGEEQESGLRGGTENVPGIVGLGKACELISCNGVDELAIDRSGSEFYNSLSAKLLHYGLDRLLHVNIFTADWKIMSYQIHGIDAQTLILLADKCGVCISAGSACNSHTNVPSHVLKAIGLTDDQARSTFRVSVSRMNTVEECQAAGVIIADCIAALHGM